MPSQIPEDVLRFLADKIDTVPQLEALLLIWGNQPRAWEAGEVSARLYVRSEVGAEILHTLRRRGLLTVESSSPPRFRYNAAADEGPARVAHVAEAYRRQLVAVTTFIHSKAPASVREFARAFDLKKER